MTDGAAGGGATRGPLGEPGGAGALRASIVRLALERGAVDEAQRWFELAMGEAADPDAMAAVGVELVRAALEVGVAAVADRWARQALAAAALAGQAGAVEVLLQLRARAALLAGRPEEAEWLLLETQVEGFEAEAPAVERHRLLGVARQLLGDYEGAELALRSALVLAAAAGEAGLVAACCQQLGVLEQARSDARVAMAWHEKAARHYSEAGAWRDAVDAVIELGRAACVVGDAEQALQWLWYAVRLGQEHGESARAAECLWQLASLADARGGTADAIHWAALSHLSGGAGGRARALLLALAQRFGVDTIESVWLARSGGGLPASLRGDLLDRVGGRWQPKRRQRKT